MCKALPDSVSAARRIMKLEPSTRTITEIDKKGQVGESRLSQEMQDIFAYGDERRRFCDKSILVPR